MASQRATERTGGENTVRGVVRKSVILTDPTTHGTSVVNTGSGDWADMIGLARKSILIVAAGGGGNTTFTVEGTVDPTGATGWVTLGTRANSVGPYATTGVTVATGASQTLFLSPDDLLALVRVNVSLANATGTTFTAWGEAAVAA